jgi:hypothetical protein
MKLSKWAFALAIATAFWPGAAVFAQIGSGLAPQTRTPSQPNQATTYTYGDYYAAQPTEPAPAVEPVVEEFFEEEEEEAAEPWRLFNQDNALGISARGYLAQSYTWNPSNPVDKFNGPVTPLDRSNEYQLNEFYGIMERVTNTEESVFDFGFRMDLTYGTTSRFYTSAGIEDHWNHGRSFYGLAMPNAYFDVAMNDWKLRMGHFTSPVGYFAVGTVNNFFNTLPYTFQYGEPFTHTGAVLSLPEFIEGLTLSGGIIQGWDNAGTEFNSHAGYLGTLGYSREDVGDSISFVQVYSPEPNLTPNSGFPFRPNFSPRYLQTFVYQRPLRAISEDLTWVFQTDFGTQTNALANGNSAQWYGINQYLLWQQTDTLAWGAGFEWFRDDDGFRVGGFLPNFATIPAGGAPLKPRGLPTTRFPYIGDFFQLTVGPKWTPSPNVIIRPNLRWDWFDGISPVVGADFNRPFDDGTKNWQVLANIDLILQF